MQDHQAVLTQAIESRLRVAFRYRATDEEETTLRVVEPWIYGFKNGKESLFGCQVEPELGAKRFDLRRVKHIELGEVCTEHPAQIDMTKWDTVLARWVPHADSVDEAA